MLKTYYYLTKPGIIYGNALTAAAGFFLASKGHVDWLLLIAALLGISLVIASACVFNNYIDRDIDAKMARTKKRALVSGKISVLNAIIYATVLGLIGFAALIIYVNLLTAAIGLIALLTYVILYGLAKRRGTYGTLVGSLAGATPPVAGYTAVTGHLDTAAWLLFFVLVLWQMPHFYSIAMYRLDDYKAAGIPVLPLKKGLHHTKVKILAYIVAFIISTAMLTITGYTGYIYLVVVLILGLAWLWRGLQGFKTTDDKRWARQMFFFSLIVILGFSAITATGGVLP